MSPVGLQSGAGGARKLDPTCFEFLNFLPANVHDSEKLPGRDTLVVMDEGTVVDRCLACGSLEREILLRSVWLGSF